MTFYKITSQDLVIRDYPIEYLSTVSSRREETGISEELDQLLFVSNRERLFETPFFNISVHSSFEIDSSSVYSKFKSKIETYVTELVSPDRTIRPAGFYDINGSPKEEDIVNGMIDNDYIVRIPPVKQYTVSVKVKSVERATPRIVEPEGF